MCSCLIVLRGSPIVLLTKKVLWCYHLYTGDFRYATVLNDNHGTCPKKKKTVITIVPCCKSMGNPVMLMCINNRWLEKLTLFSFPVSIYSWCRILYGAFSCILLPSKTGKKAWRRFTPFFLLQVAHVFLFFYFILKNHDFCILDTKHQVTNLAE